MYPYIWARRSVDCTASNHWHTVRYKWKHRGWPLCVVFGYIVGPHLFCLTDHMAYNPQSTETMTLYMLPILQFAAPIFEFTVFAQKTCTNLGISNLSALLITPSSMEFSLMQKSAKRYGWDRPQAWDFLQEFFSFIIFSIRGNWICKIRNKFEGGGFFVFRWNERSATRFGICYCRII